jgi:GNAT superfamily N-acetyltransferase
MTTAHIEAWREPPRATFVPVAFEFGAIARGERLPSLFASLAARGGIVIAALAGDELRGYATLVPSSAIVRDRWENVPDTFELGSIEVARSWRGRGIASELLATIQATLPIDQLAIFARGIAAHWETERAALSGYHYRGMLLRLLGRFGFRRWDTTDPEVVDMPLNFLAVRIGAIVPAASLSAFARVATRRT